MPKRKRRAAVEDIYSHCIRFGTCPQDVKDKVEGSTIADKILQYGSAGVFLGGLGIGTGRGSGGSTGYVPLGEGPGIRVGNRPQFPRPFVPQPLDPIGVGPREYIPLQPVDPMGPSIVPLEEIPPSIDIPGSNVEVVAEVNPVSDIPTSRVPVVTTDGDSSAVVEITPHAPPVRTISRTQYSNPAFEVAVTSNHNAGELSAADHIFINEGGGTVVGEEIALLDLSLGTDNISTGEQETSFFQSTPQEAASRIRRPYPNRLTVNREVTDPLFLGNVKSLVTFENPTFTPEDISLIFEQDVDSISAAPHPDFQDVVKLSRPYFERVGEYVRVSRYGQKASMKTRGGTVIGPIFHYYTDISAIEGGEEAIELQVLGEHSGDSVVVVDTDLDNVSLHSSSLLSSLPDEALLDHPEIFPETMQLVIGPRGRTVIPLPDLMIERPPIPPSDYGVYVFYPVSDSGRPSVYPDDVPLVILTLDTSGPNYDIHPSLLKRRRRVYV
ncbi:TPA_asm: L2 [Manis javanica papillomavirus 1]|nr:TPA_asm: L2 [Manis javanica papillomavirus 1]